MKYYRVSSFWSLECVYCAHADGYPRVTKAQSSLLDYGAYVAGLLDGPAETFDIKGDVIIPLGEACNFC